MNKTLISISIAISALIGTGCTSNTPHQAHENSRTSSAKTLTPDEDVQRIFDVLFEENVALSPQWQTSLGRSTNKDKWDDKSAEGQQRWHALALDQYQRLQQIDTEPLSKQNQLSHTLLTNQLQNAIADEQWQDYGYPINQMFGYHSGIPALLINQHTIHDEQDALDYLKRIQGIEDLIGQVISQLKVSAQQGIIVPKFAFPQVLRDCNNLLQGAPFDKDTNKDSTLLADFKKKLTTLEISDARKTELIQQAEDALLEAFSPAYQKLISELKILEKQAPEAIGVWQLPRGDEYYQTRLQRQTTTDLTAQEIHELGLKEVSRIHQEMHGIMTKVGFDGGLQDFFEFLRTDPQFTYPNTSEGKARYLQENQTLIDNMEKALPKIFNVMPKAALKVKAVEPFREKSAGKAFYQRASADGKRPGIYYVNLYDMNEMPWYQMEALAYHEALPGHHMQTSIAQELKDMPQFRRFGFYGAYIEGWGLYAELLPKEMGFYQDPYADFGRLTWELWRAVRLVVDTGIHYKRWTKQQTIDYMSKNTPNPHKDIVRAVERYAVMPGQATTYKVGMLKILELRKKSKSALGEDFDIRDFHDVVLKNGALPLDVLEQEVGNWVQAQ